MVAGGQSVDCIQHLLVEKCSPSMTWSLSVEPISAPQPARHLETDRGFLFNYVDGLHGADAHIMTPHVLELLAFRCRHAA
eukprot:6455145-Amphidinium_carterae.1